MCAQLEVSEPSHPANRASDILGLAQLGKKAERAFWPPHQKQPQQVPSTHLGVEANQALLCWSHQPTAMDQAVPRAAFAPKDQLPNGQFQPQGLRSWDGHQAARAGVAGAHARPDAAATVPWKATTP